MVAPPVNIYGNEGAIICPHSQLVVDSHAYTAGEVLWRIGLHFHLSEV